MLISCSNENLQYLAVVDPSYAYSKPVYLPFELLVPKGTVVYQDGPQDIDQDLFFSFLREGVISNHRSDELAFLLTIFHDKGEIYDIRKYCSSRADLGGHGIFKTEEVRTIDNYKISKVEVPCRKHYLYLITNGDDSYVIDPSFGVTESNKKAIDYAVEHIRFLPENETVKREEEKRKKTEGN